jgi:SAM-dependent methyltransferase
VVGLASVGLLRSVGDHRFTVVVDSLEQARSVRRRAPHASVLVSDAHRLPILPTSFDAVLVHQSLHNLEIDDAMREFARVLKPRGHLAVSYTMRDDSVPWVRRLVSIMRSIDPDAMGGDYGVAAADGLEASPFAAGVSRSDFRLWVPISRVGLLEMVAGRFPDLDRDRLAVLLEEVGDLYESSARAPQPLLLPYRVSCWRVSVSHDEFTSTLHPPTEGIRIQL